MNSQLVKQAFTDLAPDYKSTMDHELLQFWGIHYLDFVQKMVALAGVKPGEKVLDVATGSAVIPIELRSSVGRGDQIIGLDITSAMLAEGQKDIIQSGPEPAIHLVCASAMAMPFPDKSFQVVTCGLGTHHMNVPQMLAEAKRILADGGRLVISDVCATPFWRSPAGKLLLWLILQQYGLTHRAARARAEMEAYQNVRTTHEWGLMLQDFGFRQIKMDVVHPRFPWYPGGFALSALNLA